jgi:Methyltransferase domain
VLAIIGLAEQVLDYFSVRPMNSTPVLTDLIVGNCAKYYVQKNIIAMVESRIAQGRPTTIVDMGCSDGSKWHWMKEKGWGDRVRYVGFDLDTAAINRAKKTFPGWTFVAAPAYAMKQIVADADLVVSFSTLEHVYKRKLFLEAARSIMTGSSLFYLNYDNGHFLGYADWKRNIFGPLLARLGVERFYQAAVWQSEIEVLLKEVGFDVVEELNFHQATSKGFHKVFGGLPAMRQYMDAWLDYELKVNTLLYSEPAARRQANSNRYHLSKLFVLKLSTGATGAPGWSRTRTFVRLSAGTPISCFFV